MTTFAAAKLVAARELRVKLRDKTFIFSTVFFLLLAIASTVLPALLDGGPTKVATADRTVATALQGAGLEVRTVGRPTPRPSSSSATATSRRPWSAGRGSSPWTTRPATWSTR